MVTSKVATLEEHWDGKNDIGDSKSYADWTLCGYGTGGSWKEGETTVVRYWSKKLRGDWSDYGGQRIEKLANWDSVIEKWRSGEIYAVEAMRLTGIKKSSFYRLLKSWRNNAVPVFWWLWNLLWYIIYVMTYSIVMLLFWLMKGYCHC